MTRRALTYTLTGADGMPHPSTEKGAIGGHRRTKIFGRLDCPAALRAIARGGYVDDRVFFADALTARTAGYRPCAVCMPDEYRTWRDLHPSETPARQPRDDRPDNEPPPRSGTRS